MARVKLHDEMADILNENGNQWMTKDEIAALVNQRGRYQKTARAKRVDVSPGQIRLRALKYQHMFEIDRDRVRSLRP